jgi:hypothetical protein
LTSSSLRRRARSWSAAGASTARAPDAARDAGLLAQHVRVEPHVPRLAVVVELLAQPRGDLGVDLLGVTARS